MGLPNNCCHGGRRRRTCVVEAPSTTHTSSGCFSTTTNITIDRGRISLSCFAQPQPRGVRKHLSVTRKLAAPASPTRFSIHEGQSSAPCSLEQRPCCSCRCGPVQRLVCVCVLLLLFLFMKGRTRCGGAAPLSAAMYKHTHSFGDGSPEVYFQFQERLRTSSSSSATR